MLCEKMKKFSKILELTSNQRQYKVYANVQLIVPAENEGEAGYISDSILASVDYNYDYNINLIEETDEMISESFISNLKKELGTNDYQMVVGIMNILKKVRDKDNRMEIANDMIKQFKREKIKFNYDEFLSSIT